MRILHFVDGLVAGGKERQLVATAKAFKDRGHVVEIATMSHHVHYQELFAYGITLHYLVRQTKRDPKIFHAFYELCRAFKPDVIHTWDPMTSVYAVPASQLLHIPLLNALIQNAPNRIKPFSKLWVCSHATFPMSDMVLANSRAGLVAYGRNGDRSMVIYNGFDAARVSDIKPPEEIRKKYGIAGRQVVGMVASFTAAKDYSTFVRAAALVGKQRPDVTFVAAGTGPNLETMRNLAAETGANNLRFLGVINDVESVVNILDIGILMSFTEGLSNAIMEYMALGKPVIATKVQGNVEVVDDGITGDLIPVGDSELLAQTIISLLDDPARALKYGAAGKQRIAEKFSLERMEQELMGAYQRIAKKS